MISVVQQMENCEFSSVAGKYWLEQIEASADDCGSYYMETT